MFCYSKIIKFIKKASVSNIFFIKSIWWKSPQNFNDGCKVMQNAKMYLSFDSYRDENPLYRQY